MSAKTSYFEYKSIVPQRELKTIKSKGMQVFD
jgi:hypothetical protein